MTYYDTCKNPGNSSQFGRSVRHQWERWDRKPANRNGEGSDKRLRPATRAYGGHAFWRIWI